MSTPLFLKLDKAIPMALILNESITNSLKFAFDEFQDGFITIEIIELENGLYEILIKDNGVGIPDNILADTSERVGLDLIKILGDQIDGEVRISSNEGTEVRVIFETK